MNNNCRWDVGLSLTFNPGVSNKGCKKIQNSCFCKKVGDDDIMECPRFVHFISKSKTVSSDNYYDYCSELSSKRCGKTLKKHDFPSGPRMPTKQPFVSKNLILTWWTNQHIVLIWLHVIFILLALWKEELWENCFYVRYRGHRSNANLAAYETESFGREGIHSLP